MVGDLIGQQADLLKVLKGWRRREFGDLESKEKSAKRYLRDIEEGGGMRGFAGFSRGFRKDFGVRK